MKLIIIDNGISDYELQKVKNKFISTKVFSEISAHNKGISIGYARIGRRCNGY